MGLSWNEAWAHFPKAAPGTGAQRRAGHLLMSRYGLHRCPFPTVGRVEGRITHSLPRWPSSGIRQRFHRHSCTKELMSQKQQPDQAARNSCASRWSCPCSSPRRQLSPTFFGKSAPAYLLSFPGKIYLKHMPRSDGSQTLLTYASDVALSFAPMGGYLPYPLTTGC